MRTILFPFKDVKNYPAMSAAHQMTLAEAEACRPVGGMYPLGINGFSHGGQHMKPNGSWKDNAVQAIADGKIIAYRLGTEWKDYDFDPGQPKQSISTSFVLIEHNLEQAYVGSPPIMFKNYRFYSLYMHLASKTRLSQLSSSPARPLPLFLVSEVTSKNMDTNPTTPFLTRHTPITVLSDISKPLNGLVQFASVPTPPLASITGWVEREAIISTLPATSSTPPIVGLSAAPSISMLNYPIWRYFTSNLTTFNSSIQFDTVVNCNIPVKAGDIIGYPGGGGDAVTHTMDDIIQLDIFTDDRYINFLENVNGANTDRLIFTPSNKFMAGKLYDADNEYDYIKPDNPTIFEPAGPQPSAPDVTTDADFLAIIHATTKPAPNNALWFKKDGSAYFNANGDYKEGLPSTISPSERQHLIFKQKPEWVKSDANTRYTILKTGNSVHAKISDAKYNNLVKFHELISFWSDVGTLPSPSKIWYFNPIYFIAHLQRIMTPYHDAQPIRFTRFIERAINETILVLQSRLREMNDYKALVDSGNMTVAAASPMAAKFNKWFGYHPTNPLPAQPGVWTSIPTTIPLVTNLKVAVDNVHGTINKLLEAYKTVSVHSMLQASMLGSAYAYVYGDDDAHKHISLGVAFLRNRNDAALAADISNNNHINTLCHEPAHFNNIGGWSDVTIKSSTAAGITEIEGYEAVPCQRIAARYPSAALFNADNFSFFICDGLPTTVTDHFIYEV
jgi:hypothetical protein